MAVSTVGSTSTDFQTTATEWTSLDVSHTVASGTTLLLISVGTRANDVGDLTDVIWDIPTANEAMTLIDRTTSSGLSGDHKMETWGLVNPTAKTANINLSGTTVDNSTIVVVNYQGTETASVAAATNFIEEQVNNSATLTAVYTGGGTTGNKLYAVHGFRGSDTDPISVNGTWAEVVTNYLADTSGTLNMYASDEDASAGVTFTSSVSDENAGHMIELVAAAGGTTDVSFSGSNRGIMRGVGRGVG